MALLDRANGGSIFRFAKLPSTSLLHSLPPEELQRYHRTVTQSIHAHSHFDLLQWLQGDMQRYLPHEALITSWGDFGAQKLRHDILSHLPGVRSKNIKSGVLTPFMGSLHARWKELGNEPYAIQAGANGLGIPPPDGADPIGQVLKSMKTAVVHGLVDTRGQQECLYVVFSAQRSLGEREQAMFAAVLPYIDTALRQVKHLHPTSGFGALGTDAQDGTILASITPDHNLSIREAQILHWVAMGKTNPEIAEILHISSFTVKNHMQRVFKKLDVSNRTQAVNKYRLRSSHAQN